MSVNILPSAYLDVGYIAFKSFVHYLFENFVGENKPFLAQILQRLIWYFFLIKPESCIIWKGI